MFEDLKKNISQEKKIIADMKAIAAGYRDDATNRDFYASSLKSLAQQLDILNATVPELLKEWSPTSNPTQEQPRKLESSNQKIQPKPEATKKNIVKMSYVSPSTKEKHFITINKRDKVDFLKKLKLSEDALKKIRTIEEEDEAKKPQKANQYVVFSNKIFGKYSDKMDKQFSDISKDLKQANIQILLSSYLSTSMMSVSISFVVGLLIFLTMIIINTSNWIYISAPFGLAGLTLTGFYLYPSSVASSVQKNISYELPFVTIHMAAIAGSNITPIKIFKIISTSREYPNIGAEMRKVIMQTEIYGYDMVTSLKDIAKKTSNKKLSELFSGLATNISSGGSLGNYLKKKSESFLVDYRLERQKYTGLAGTFMDVYISILIAAPLILMMMFIIMNVAGLGMGGLGITAIMFFTIGGIVVANIVFIVVLNIKQPRV